MSKSEKPKRFKLFDLQRDGKGISKSANIGESGLKRFFITYKNNFGKLVSVNMFFVLGNFPIFFLIAALSGYSKLTAYLPAGDVFQNLSNLFITSTPSPSNMSLFTLIGLQNETLVNTPLTYVLYGIGALVIFTFGIVNVGTAYILRNMAMGEPVFVWTDFFYAVKRNWKQALPFGIIDAIINALLVFNIYTTVTGGSNFLLSIMFWAHIVLIILYFFMRCYIYVQMVTFDLTVYKIIKNSLIFSLLGLKRNILALLGTAACLILELAFIFSFSGILVPAAVMAPLLILLSTLAYIKVYASYFKIKEIMIDPYKAEHPELFATEPDEDFEVIMKDDVTERERLEEIKKRNNIK